jgi:hypothetical protein
MEILTATSVGTAPSNQAIPHWLAVGEEKRIQCSSSHTPDIIAAQKRYRLTRFDLI